jgi:hypothetical protein
MSLRRKQGSTLEECEKEKEEEHREDKCQTDFTAIQPTSASGLQKKGVADEDDLLHSVILAWTSGYQPCT